MRLRDLEIALERCPPHPEPKAALEQYRTPARLAAQVLYDALAHGDIEGKRVADMGCGTGALAIGAALLGASYVVGVDIDEEALYIAERCAERLDVDVEFVRSDVRNFSGAFDTVIMNPPFGYQAQGADRPFLSKALEIASAIYTVHAAASEGFVDSFIEEHGGRVLEKKSYKFEIPYTFSFHKMERRPTEVMVYHVRRDMSDVRRQDCVTR
ncbi:MAG: METTL5 family protein [Candidatus Thermoplasmatota archaeon]